MPFETQGKAIALFSFSLLSASSLSHESLLVRQADRNKPVATMTLNLAMSENIRIHLLHAFITFISYLGGLLQPVMISSSFFFK